MLTVDVDVIRGILFIRLEGELTKQTVHDFDRKLNYLLYKQGMHFFVFNFCNIEVIDQSIFSHLQSKLVEIFLSCGKVGMCGLSDLYRHFLGTQERLFYVNYEGEAFQYFSV